MFNIFEKKGQTIIQLHAGDSAQITTTPFNDTNNDGLYNPEDYDEPIVLDENGYVMFIVASPSGRIYIKKFLTMNDYNDNGELAFNLEPSDTKNLQPYRYLFSFTYFPNKTEQAYTYSTGIFEILKSLGNVDTLDEYLNPPIIEPDEDDSNGTDNPDDNTTGDDVTDDNDDNETIEPDTPTDPTIPDETDPNEPDTPNTDNGDGTNDSGNNITGGDADGNG